MLARRKSFSVLPSDLFPFFAFRDSPFFDWYDGGSEWVLKANVPGVREDNIEVVEHEGYLTIRARKESRAAQSGFGWQMRSHSRSTWQRTFPLPAAVDASRAEAILEDGVLTVRLPKHQPRLNFIRRIQQNLSKLKLPGFHRKGKIKISVQ